MNGSTWSTEEIALLREIFPHLHSEDVAILMGRSTSAIRNAAQQAGLRKTTEYLKSNTCGRAHSINNPAMLAAQFKPGQPSWSKGTKGRVGIHEACRANHFKPGQKPPQWRPLGSERLAKDGVLVRKVADTGIKSADWQTVHSLVWIEQVGPIPAGSIVVFKAGKKTSVASEIKPENLECLSRAELMHRNSYQRYPPEIAKAIQLRGALNRQINKHTKAINEPHQHSPSASS
ncbi:MAG: HNH endonuclease [Pseudomonadota bacterium]